MSPFFPLADITDLGSPLSGVKPTPALCTQSAGAYSGAPSQKEISLWERSSIAPDFWWGKAMTFTNARFRWKSGHAVPASTMANSISMEPLQILWAKAHGRT
jgi:hypothetical protein